MIYTDAERLARISNFGARLMEAIADEGITRDGIVSDYRVQWLIATPLYNIGEQTYHVSRELKEAHPEVPWSGVSGLRHRLVHEYEGTNWTMIADIVFDELPPFLKQVEEIRGGTLTSGFSPCRLPGAVGAGLFRFARSIWAWDENAFPSGVVS